MRRGGVVVALVALAVLLGVFLLPGWGRKQHEQLDEKTAEQFARTELARVAGRRQDRGQPALEAASSACLVARRIDPDFKQYVFSFSPGGWFVAVASTPESHGLDARVLNVPPTSEGAPTVWAGAVAHCGR